MADAMSSDKFAQVRGFKVDIAGADGSFETDAAWESVSSGTLMINSDRTNSPGHKTVGEITLRGAMTDGRKAMCQWINETVEGKPWKRTITITPMNLDGTIGQTLIFEDCVLTGYRLPTLRLRSNDPCPPEEEKEELRFGYIAWSVRP